MRSELREQVLKEINDPKYSEYTHGRKHTNDKGCKGPLCLKAGRDCARNRARRKRHVEGRPQKPVYKPNWKDIFLSDLYIQYLKGKLT